MSMYCEFFIRNNKTFLPLPAYSRNNYIYEKFHHYAPWEKVKPLTNNALKTIAAEMHYDLDKSKESLTKTREERALIVQFNNSVEDKLEALGDNQDAINDWEEQIEEISMGISFAGFLSDILEEIRYDDRFNENEYLYVGIECGSEPEIEI